MAYTPINNLPPAPQRNDSPEDFVTKADAHVAALATWTNQVNNAGIYVDTVVSDIEATAAQNVSDMNTIKTDTISSRDQAEGFAAASEQSARDSQQYSQISLAAANFKGEWQDLSGPLSIPASVYWNGKYWVLLNNVANVSSETPSDTATNWAELAAIQVVRTPVIISPQSGSVGVIPTPTLEASAYGNIYGDVRNYRLFQVDDGDFSTPIYEFQGDTDSHTVASTLPLNTQLKWRCKDVAVGGAESNWSGVSVFSTGDVTVGTPTLSVEGSPTDVPESPLLETSAFSVIGGSDTHLNTDWQILNDQLVVVWESLADSANKLSVTVDAGVLQESTTYTFRARHRGTTYGVGAWVSVVATTKAMFFDDNSDVDGLTFAAMDTAGNFDSTTDTGFFGEIPATDLVDNYDYRGTWSASIAYTAGQSVVYNAVKYVALTSTTGNQPDTSPTQWAVDGREFLPTGRWLFEHMGFGQGVLQFAGNTASDAGWLKFYSHGKVLYVAKKPFAHSISWDAIACRDGVFGDRTVRIGTKLYKVRLLTGAASDPIDLTNIAATNSCAQNYGGGSEYNELIYRIHQTVVTCGADTHDGGPQVGANWASYTDADLVIASGNGRAKWTQETASNNTSGRVYRGNDRLSGLYSPASSFVDTACGWLPVLELISDGDEPYNSAVLGVGPTQLTYDFHTDTGYFGTVSSAEFISGSALASSIGLTSGTAINDTTDWLKFYWHGQIHYIPMKPLRHSVSWDHIYDRGAVYGVSSMGLFGKGTAAPSVVQNREVTIGTDTFRVKLLKGAENGDVDGSTSFPAADESGRNSEYNDLIYRVHQDVPSSASGLTYDGGGQIGDNWASYTDTDLVIAAGDGRAKWAIERRSDSTSGRVLRGPGRLSVLGSLTSSSVYTAGGWLPSLVLKP
jgi:hypothetical protein